MNRLEIRIKTVWRIRMAIWVAAIFLAALIYDVTNLIGRGDAWIPPGVVSTVALVGGLGAVLIVPRLQYQAWRYELRPEELYMERGVLTRVRTVVPLRRVQHLDVSQGLLEREFDLGRFIVHTAGTRASVVVLPGLHIDDANRLHDTVKAYVVEESP